MLRHYVNTTLEVVEIFQRLLIMPLFFVEAFVFVAGAFQDSSTRPRQRSTKQVDLGLLLDTDQVFALLYAAHIVHPRVIKLLASFNFTVMINRPKSPLRMLLLLTIVHLT